MTLAEHLRLIVITDRGLSRPRSVVDVVREAVSAGARCVQIRDKGATARETAALGRVLLDLVRPAGGLLIVNDRVDVALAIGADGAHLGPHDVPVEAIRGMVPRGFVLGASTDVPEEARRLVAAGADYIGCGAVYATSSKAHAGGAIGPDGLRRVVDAVDVPVVGIGGITPERARSVASTGAAGAAAIGAIMAAPDVGEAVDRFLRAWPPAP